MDTLNIKRNPYALLLFTTIALLVAFAFRPMANIDFKDMTMYSLPLDNMVSIIPLFLISLWLFYLVTRKTLFSRTITWIHVLVTVITTLLIVSVTYIGINPSPDIRERHELIGNTIQALSIIFIVGQLSYIVNVLLGLLSRHTAR